MLEPREQAKLLAKEVGEPAAARGCIVVDMKSTGGYIELSWTNAGAIGYWDYVALYNVVPTNPDGYLANQWQYTTKQDSPYVTGTPARGEAGPQYWVAYCGYDYKEKKYKVVSTAGPKRPA